MGAKPRMVAKRPSPCTLLGAPGTWADPTRGWWPGRPASTARGGSVSSPAPPAEDPWADPAPLIRAFISLPEQLISLFFPKGLAPGNTAGYSHPPPPLPPPHSLGTHTHP